MSKGKPMSYDEANKIAIPLLVKLGLLTYTEKIAIVGSLRRKEEIINDIDFQIVGDRYYVKRALGREGFYTRSDGEKRQIYSDGGRTGDEIYINCFYTYPEYWGSALMHNTGPSRYNIRKRYLVKKKGWILNQYGLYRPIEDEDGYVLSDDRHQTHKHLMRINTVTEKDIYNELGWEYCKAEDRV